MRPHGAVRRLTPGVATIVTGFMLATGIALGATTGSHHPRQVASAGALTTAQARAAVIAALAQRNAAAATTPAPTSTPSAPATTDTTPVAAAPTLPAPAAVAATTPSSDTSTDTATATTPSATDPATTPTTPDTTTALPNVTNAWVISVPATSFNAADLASAPASLARDTITPQGVLLEGYSLLSTSAEANAIATVSGQPPNASTSAGCTTRDAVDPATIDAKTGIVTGDGCLFPAAVSTIAAQLTGRGDTVRSYDLTAGAGAGCVGAAAAADPRAPLPYFAAYASDPACATAVGDGAALTADLANAAVAPPALSWITAPDDPAAAAAFTATTLAAIEAAPSYQSGGLILVVPDSPAASEPADLAVGAIAISPFIPASTTNTSPTGPYGVLRLLQDLFTLPATAGAGAEDVSQVDRSIFETTASGARAHHQPTRSSS